LPVPQTATENCVAHNGSLIPVPGRDIMVQAWYQGGVSVFDFTDSSNPVEIAFFDRGPIDAKELIGAGYWSVYWYNGNIYGSEIARGLDVFGLTPTAELSANEIAAAREVQAARLNVQHQDRYVNQPSFAVARSYVDQLVRAENIDPETLDQVNKFIDRAERFQSGPQANAAKANLRALANQRDGAQYDALRATLRALGSK
jgi:hypothetical protein